MSKYGRKYKIEILGTSHGPEISVTIKGVPIGFEINAFELDEFMRRRSAIGNDLTTPRKEPDKIIWRKGAVDTGLGTISVTGRTIEAVVKNEDVNPGDYEKYKEVPRPGHADYAAIMKDGEHVEIEGGGRFSGRLTVGLCIAGAIASQLLATEGILLNTKITEIGGSKNTYEFEDIIAASKEMGDSVGGIVECKVTGLYPGSCGDSYFDGLEGRISEAVFAIPAVKGVEFGAGFEAAKLMGSENNDAFSLDDEGNVITITNNHGGILGGIATGMPIVVRAAIKPTPSIAIPQKSINLVTGMPETICVTGRHDPCIAVRAQVCVESAVAIALLDSLMYSGEYSSELEEARAVIDEQNDIILEAFEKRMRAAETIGKIKEKRGTPVFNPAREAEVLENMKRDADPELEPYDTVLFEKLMELSRDLQNYNIYGREAKLESGVKLGEEIEEAQERSKRRLTTGLLGKSLSHSYSQTIHEMISSYTNLNYSYELFEVEPENVEEFLEARDFDALNVTIPYKQTVMPYLDEISDEANKIGAVNTIVKQGDKLVGYNTDFYGLVYTFKKYEVNVKDKKCLILGAGGASKAVAAALEYLGAGSIIVLTHEDIDNGKASEYKDCDIIVNATPVGMYPAMDVSPVDLSGFNRLKFALDLIYNPARTKFLTDARLKGIKAVSGTDMLVSQAIRSAEKFYGIEFGKDLTISLQNEIIHQLRIENENIVIIGMPGSGKTTIGRLVAEDLGKEFYDTDEMVEYRTGKSPKEIINTEGEEAFRKYEEDACNVLSKVYGAVISTGGGVINRDTNFTSLARNGRFVFIEKGMDSLAVKDRPISEKLGLERLYLERLPKYENWADSTVNIDGLTVDDAATKIIISI